VIKKLNNKLREINKKVYELLKLFILIKIDLNENKSNCTMVKCEEKKDALDKKSLPLDSDSIIDFQIYPQISKKIEELIHDVKKYFEEVEPLNEHIENKQNNTVIDIEEELITSTIGKDWINLKPVNDI
jgi:hypothetical protein